MKKEILWEEKYSVQFPEIDFQHQHFLKLINRINQQQEDEFLEKEGPKLLDELEKYAHFHFQNEENLMLATSYPDFRKHKSEHDDILKTLREKLDRISEGKESHLSLVDFMLEWFTNHTTRTDKDLGKYLITKSPYARRHQ